MWSLARALSIVWLFVGCTSPRSPTPDPAPSSDPISRAHAIHDRATASLHAGDLPAARAAADGAIAELLALDDAALGDRGIDLLESLGVLDQRSGGVERSRDAFARVVSAREKALGDDHPALQKARQDFAVALGASGDLQGERALEEKVLAIRERTLPDDHPDLQAVRENLAGTIYVLGDLEGARSLFEKVLAVREKTLPEDHNDVQQTLLNLALVLKATGDLPRARSFEERVLATRERTLPDGARELQVARLNLASTLRAMDELQAARALEEKVVAAQERTLPVDHPDALIARQELASTIYALGDLEGARVIEEGLLAVRERTLPEDHPLLQGSRMNLAVTIEALGDHEGARSLEEKVLSIYERTLPEDHPDLQNARANLAVLFSSVGNDEGARVLQERVLATRERVLPKDDLETLKARLNLAATYDSLGDPARARALQEDVLEGYSRLLPDDHPDLGLARQNLGITLYHLGELDAARGLLEKVLSVRSLGLPAGHPDLLRVQDNVARCRAGLGDEAGLREVLEAMTAGFAASIRNGQTLSTRERSALVSSLADGFSSMLSMVLLVQDGEALAAHTFGVLENARGLIATGLPHGSSTADAELSKLERRSRELRASIADLVAGARDPERGPPKTDEIAVLVREQDQIETAISKRLVGMGSAPPTLDAAALARALEPGACAVGYRRYARSFFDREHPGDDRPADSLLAHVVRGDGKIVRVELGPLGAVDAAAARWRKAVGKPIERGQAVETKSNEEREAGEELRRLVLDPVLAAAGDAKILHVCLDDALHLVPLDALPLDEAVVGEKIRIRNEVSFFRLLAAESPARRAAGEASFVAVGGVDFNAEIEAGQVVVPEASAPPLSGGTATRSGPLGLNWGPLSETRAEARDLSELFRNTFGREARMLSGKEATKRALFEAANGARYLHVATHGYFAPESVRSMADPFHGGATTLVETTAPGDETELWKAAGLEQRVTGLAPMTLCGLALAGANRGVDSHGRVPGVVTGEELATLDLSRCELAVLSACETNVGITRAGQGIQSLQAALHSAGARTAITSLWKVDDEKTRELFEDFYTRIWVKKEGKADALWGAKMALRKSGAATRDWAGWILTGSPD